MATSSSSAFSYAQAAKGQGSSSNSSNAVNQDQSPPPSVDPAASAKPSTPAESAAEFIDTPRDLEHDHVVSDNKDLDSVVGSEDSKAKTVNENAPQPSQDEVVSRLEQPWRRNDKGTRSPSATTRDEPDNRRRKNKKNKNNDKQSTEQPATEKSKEKEPETVKIELAEAPIPAVNVWQQRQEALSSKVVSSPPRSSDSISTEAPAAPVIALQVSTPAESAAEGATKPLPTTTERTRSERNDARTSRETKTDVPPPVVDSTAWPIPETSIPEDKKKIPVDKSDRSEKDKESDDSQPKPKQKKAWITYDYVPTVNFQTQIPQLRGSKSRTGPRGSNGPRSSNGNHTTDKPSASASNRSGESKERVREVANGSGEISSTPPVTKRASVDTSATREQKKTNTHNAAEKPKEQVVNQSHEGHSSRERQEGRTERGGRGGYRSRGGHNGINSHPQGPSTNQSTFPTTNSMSSRPRNHYSPPPRTGSHGQMYTAPPRGGRGNHHGSNSNFHRLSLPNGRVPPPVQTQFPVGYEYPMAPMTSIPYQQPSYWDSMIAATLKNQIEYYFSVENLCKDVYLRKRMDSQGFVPLHFVAGFRRVRDLSQDLNLLRAVCEDSSEIDFVIGEDDGERLRRTHGWEKFVMPREERDELARGDGPSVLNFRTRSYGFGQQPAFNAMPPMAYGVASPSPAFNPTNDLKFQQNAAQDMRNGYASSNGHVNGANESSQLSAEVPDFSPSGVPSFQNPLKNGASHFGQYSGNATNTNGMANGYGHPLNSQS